MTPNTDDHTNDTAPLERTPEPDEAEADVRAAPNNLQVLVIDDEELVRHFCADLLRHLGHSVITLESGDAAERFAREHQGRIDVMLIDRYMPRCDGVQTLERLRPLLPNAKAIFYTGQMIGDERNCQDLLELPEVIGMLRKPFKRAELEELLRAAHPE